MFVDKSDRAAITAAIDAGVSAYVVGGLQKDRVQSILDVCISRFNAMARMQDELETAKTALEERKVIDRAKGILMRAKGVSHRYRPLMGHFCAVHKFRAVARLIGSSVAKYPRGIARSDPVNLNFYQDASFGPPFANMWLGTSAGSDMKCPSMGSRQRRRTGRLDRSERCPAVRCFLCLKQCKENR